MISEAWNWFICLCHLHMLTTIKITNLTYLVVFNSTQLQFLYILCLSCATSREDEISALNPAGSYSLSWELYIIFFTYRSIIKKIWYCLQIFVPKLWEKFKFLHYALILCRKEIPRNDSYINFAHFHLLLPEFVLKKTTWCISISANKHS